MFGKEMNMLPKLNLLLICQNKLDSEKPNNELKCRKPVFMQVSGICFIKWFCFGFICVNNYEILLCYDVHFATIIVTKCTIKKAKTKQVYTYKTKI